MSYCVNCGVELDATASFCPLCHTPVLNPGQPVDEHAPKPFPTQRGEVAPASKRELALLITAMLASVAVCCGVLNLFLNQQRPWSLYVIGAAVMLWIWFVPPLLARGMHLLLRLLLDEFAEAMEEDRINGRQVRAKHITLATGRLAYRFIKQMAMQMEERYEGLQIDVIAIRNDFFGEMITVSGLLTGQDIMAQLKDRDLGEKLLLPQNVLKSGEPVFLDDYTLDDIEKALQVRIDIVKSSGRDFIEAILSD